MARARNPGLVEEKLLLLVDRQFGLSAARDVTAMRYSSPPLPAGDTLPDPQGCLKPQAVPSPLYTYLGESVIYKSGTARD